MKCLLCCHDKVHKHGKTEKGHQRYKCPQCSKTFPEHFETLYYGRHLSQTEVHTIIELFHSIVSNFEIRHWTRAK